MAELAPSFGNGAVIEMVPGEDSDSRSLLCSCGHAYLFAGSAVKTYWISDAAYERGYDYDIVPTPGVEDYYDPPAAPMSGLKKAA